MVESSFFPIVILYEDTMQCQLIEAAEDIPVGKSFRVLLCKATQDQADTARIIVNNLKDLFSKGQKP
jgi:hypothetical protein